MIKALNLEKIQNKDKFQNEKILTKEEVKKALDFIIKKIDENLDTFTNKYPTPASFNNIYKPIDNIEWTNGFWTGMLWMAYEYTGDDKYLKAAEIQVESYIHRIENKIEVAHHDLGFLYSLSCVAAYKITGNKAAKEAALKAAKHLTTRYQEKGKFIQAWGELGEKDNYRLIIDCLLNIPLLYWAAEETGDKSYYEMAYNHYISAANNVIRDDASTFHTFYFDPETGEPIKGVTRQGYSDTSCWARGKAWGIYGVPLTYIYTKDSDAERVYKSLLNYFINRLPEDKVCFWDLIFNDGDDQSRDSSAAAIAVCGMLEMDKWLKEEDECKEFYKKTAHGILRSLIEKYTSEDCEECNGILLHGVYSWHSGKGVDECNIWGDYYYMEALMRLYTNWKLYW